MPPKKVPSTNASTENLVEFKRLFWAARQAHRKAEKAARLDDPAHLTALDYAEAHDWTWANPFLTALWQTYHGDDATALASLETLQVPASLKGEYYFVLGLAHHGLSQWTEAIGSYQKALADHGFSGRGIAWNNLGNAYAEKKDFDQAIEAYQKALATPDYDSPGMAWNNLGNAYAEKKDFDRAIEACQKALATPGYDTLGMAWNNLGNVYAEKKDFDRAIEACQKALATPGYKSLGMAWNNLGNAYAGKRDFDRAIEAYQKALATPGYKSPGMAWNNLGNAYAEKKDFDQAIEACQKALATLGYKSAGMAWNNLGNAYAGKKDFDRAIEAYQKALATTNYDTPHLTRLNLALSLQEANRLAEARHAVEQVLAEPDSENQHERAKRIASLLAATARAITPKPNELALVAPTPPDLASGPEGAMKEALLKRETRYEEYLKKAPAAPQPDDLTILRGWSSSVTLLEGGHDCQWRGGGYFIKWRGHGIVIDPGFDFLDNFHDAGFHGTEINAVLVSHNHPDHNYDLGSLDDLCYELFRKAPNPANTLFALDEDTAKTFPDNTIAHRGSACKLTRADSERKRWLGGPKENLPFTIEHFPVAHGPDAPHAVGLRIRLHAEKKAEPDIIVGYTGDGEFTEGLVSHLKGVDLLIAHVSQPDVAEFNDPSVLKKVHLGYNGLIRLVRETKPRLTLVGEFWAGLADLRLDLIAGIRLRSGIPAVLPACLGLRLRLADFTVRCTRTGKQVPAATVKVAPPLREFGELGYLSPDSIL